MSTKQEIVSIAGIDGVFSGSFALFIAMAMVVNVTFKKVIIPLR